jgi:hypothetical protein
MDWPAPTLDDAAEYMGATPLPLGRSVMPMHLFPVEHRRRIHAEVLALQPPGKWLALGGEARRPLAQITSRAWYEWHWYRGIDPDARREPLSPWLRAAVIARDGYVCGICGGDVESTDVHIDHIFPRSRGGRDQLDNLQVAHSLCNLRKGARI